jgi:hypothetical protein
LRISTLKPKLPLLNNWLLLKPTTTLDMTTPATITQVTITARARLSILAMTRRTTTKTMERKSMPAVLRTRISSWS